jgi:HK97 family phage prohead protease
VRTKRIDRPFEIKSVSDAGVFTGYGSVFGVVDSYRDVVIKGAFARSLDAWKQKAQLPALLWQHRSDTPIGVWTKMAEDDHGLYVEGRLALKTQQGAEAHELLKMGAVRGLSIGYMLGADGFEYDKERDAYLLKEIDLFETSLVTFPANEEANVTEVKAALSGGPKEIERYLRDAGFSRSQAKALLADGIRGLRDADTGIDDVKALLQSHPLLSRGS